MWTVVYMAHNRNDAEALELLLKREGFLVKMKPVYKNIDSNRNCYQLLVTESEAEEAQAIILEAGF